MSHKQPNPPRLVTDPPPPPRPRRRSPSFSPDQRARLRETLHGLRDTYGTYARVAEVMGLSTVEHVLYGEGGSYMMAVRAANLAGVPVASIIDGEIPSEDRCPTCGQGGHGSLRAPAEGSERPRGEPGSDGPRSAIAHLEDARERDHAAPWPRDPDGTIDARRAMTALARSFPTLARAPGIDPFDVDAFVGWLCTGGAPGRDARAAARFVLQVWNPDVDWREVGRDRGIAPERANDLLGPFNVARDVRGWDAEHQRAFRAWCAAPFWP